jgi:AraC-like DNA-binding protein
MLRFQESPPPEALRAFVHSMWTFSAEAGPPLVHRVLPDGCVSIVLAMGDEATKSTLVGPRRTELAVPVTAGVRFHGVRMRPEGAGALLGIVPRAWVERVAPLAEANPALAAMLASADLDESRDRLVAALEARAAGAQPDALVRDALEAIDNGEARIGALAARLGVSTRTLERRFSDTTGLSPKAFARIRRFRLAVANVLRPEPHSWGRVAADHGFADQSHFVREVTALAGEPPSALEVRLARIAHVDVRP